MDYRLCLKFDNLSKYLPDELNGTTSLDINKLGNVQNYCSNGESEGTGCKTDLDKINGGCLWLFEQNIINNIDSLSKDQFKIIIIYIIIWLNYMINLKKDGKTNNLNDFYTQYIEKNTYYSSCKKNDNDCSNTLKEKTGYNNFKEIIDKRKDFVNINFDDVSKVYAAFKSLCSMYNEIDASKPECKEYLEKAKEFVKKYDELNNDSSISEDSSYKQILSNLSTDYNNFKNYCSENQDDCSDIPHLSPIKTINKRVQDSGQIVEATSSSSSIISKIIPVLSIFGAIPIFLGIVYKYSLFGFRKRSQKQHLREKIKK
ncbi:hypothetical protein YYC_02367 [Plasmodium yoelii 17X]|uniref:YIR protein n=1 Tax=Plasmodium yoelii 17X TaxID=1323249 RepID=V7PQY6_PLAYE|nr:hypothetical protein YYC_02367 [Plasmodium yoelii 17X]